MGEDKILTLADFGDNLNGFGDPSQVQDLQKALGTGTPGEAYGSYADGSALRPESLEGTLKIVTAQEKHIKLWKQIDKKPAYNTVEEFNVLSSYGGDASPFFVEGGLPEEEDSTYTRQSALVKFLGTTRVITHPMTLVRTAHGDVVARETRNGTLWLLQQMERNLFFADSSLNPLAFDGLYTQMLTQLGATAQQIIDMKGQPLNEDVLEDGATCILDNYGNPGKLFLPPLAHSDLSKIMFPRQRTTMPAPTNGVAGTPLNAYQSNAGTFEFEPDIFIRPRTVVPAAAASGSPAAPAWDLAPLTAAPSATGVGMPAGTYTYRVSAVNSKGESLANAAETVAVGANGQVTIVFERVATAPVATSYRIYRDNGDGTVLFMKEIADVGPAPVMTYIDRNQDIPGTMTAFLFDMDEENSFRFKQLAPLMKLPLARISAAERFMILLYGMPIMYNARRNVVYKNIGRRHAD